MLSVEHKLITFEMWPQHASDTREEGDSSRIQSPLQYDVAVLWRSHYGGDVEGFGYVGIVVLYCGDPTTEAM